MDLFRNGTDKTGTGQVLFIRQILSEPFVFLSEPFQFFQSCKRPFGNKLVESLIRDKGNTNFNSDLFSSAEFLVFKIQNVFVFSK